MKVYGKEISQEHIALVHHMIKKNGVVRLYQISGLMAGLGFNPANGESDRAADRILRRLKKDGLIEYRFGRWRPKDLPEVMP